MGKLQGHRWSVWLEESWRDSINLYVTMVRARRCGYLTPWLMIDHRRAILPIQRARVRKLPGTRAQFYMVEPVSVETPQFQLSMILTLGARLLHGRTAQGWHHSQGCQGSQRSHRHWRAHCLGRFRLVKALWTKTDLQGQANPTLLAFLAGSTASHAR